MINTVRFGIEEKGGFIFNRSDMELIDYVIEVNDKQQVMAKIVINLQGDDWCRIDWKLTDPLVIQNKKRYLWFFHKYVDVLVPRTNESDYDVKEYNEYKEVLAKIGLEFSKK